MCYDKSADCTLICGHKFCKSCVKSWYFKGNTCPMCRRSMYFRRMPVKKWKEEFIIQKKNQIYEETFQDVLEELMEPFEFDEDIVLHRINVPTMELESLERTFRAVKDYWSPEEIDWLLNDSMDYYSDRRAHLCNRTYSEAKHRYPNEKRKPKTIHKKGRI